MPAFKPSIFDQDSIRSFTTTRFNSFIHKPAININSDLDGHTETVRARDALGGDVSATRSNGSNAVRSASQNGHTKTIVALSQLGADVRARRHSTAMLAAQNGRTAGPRRSGRSARSAPTSAPARDARRRCSRHARASLTPSRCSGSSAPTSAPATPRGRRRPCLRPRTATRGRRGRPAAPERTCWAPGMTAGRLSAWRPGRGTRRRRPGAPARARRRRPSRRADEGRRRHAAYAGRGAGNAWTVRALCSHPADVRAVGGATGRPPYTARRAAGGHARPPRSGAEHRKEGKFCPPQPARPWRGLSMRARGAGRTLGGARRRR